MTVNPLEHLANELLTVLKVVVLGVFAWKAAEAGFKERFSLMWVLAIAAALVGGFLFAGEATFRFFWRAACALLGGCE